MNSSAATWMMVIAFIVIIVFTAFSPQVEISEERTNQIVKTTIAGMANTYEDVGWREELGSEDEPVSGQHFVIFSENGNKYDTSSYLKAIVANKVDGEVKDSRRLLKGKDKFEVNIVKFKYFSHDNVWVTEYVVRAPRVKK